MLTVDFITVRKAGRSGEKHGWLEEDPPMTLQKAASRDFCVLSLGSRHNAHSHHLQSALLWETTLQSSLSFILDGPVPWDTLPAPLFPAFL